MDKDTKELLWKYSEKVQEMQRTINTLKDTIQYQKMKIEYLTFEKNLLEMNYLKGENK